MLIKHQLRSNFFIIFGFHPLFDKEPKKFKYILNILILSFILFSPIFSLTSSACSLPRYDEAYSSLPHNIFLVNINISYKIAKGNNILFFKENKYYFKYLSIISNNLSLLIGLSK